MLKKKRSKLSRKLDRARVSNQKWEIAYSRKLAKDFLKKVDKQPEKYKDKDYNGKIKTFYIISSRLNPSQIARICKHFLKLSKK